jgi:hypothetical protein
MAKSSKSSLRITREHFRTTAKPVTVAINGKEQLAMPKEFSTGSLGWNLNEKAQIEVGGEIVVVQVGLNLTIVGSKDLPQDAAAPSAPAAAPAPPAEKADGQADF